MNNLEQILAQTTSRTEIKVITQNFPHGGGEYFVELSNSRPDLILLYNNLAADLVAAVVAKLGVEYSKFLIEENADSLNNAMEPVFSALKAGTVKD